MYKIEIENNVTHQKYTYDNVEDKNNGKKLFYNFNIDTSNLDDGEYTLSLYDGNNLITSELLKIGDFNNKSIQYSKGSNVFIDAKSTKIDVAATGIKFGYSTFTEIPDIYDFSNLSTMSNLFYNCENLTTITMLDTSSATHMNHLFYSCRKLQSIPLLNCSKVASMTTIFGYSNINTLTDLGGFKDLKISVTSNFLDILPNLTVDSLMNVINNVYDLTANGLSGKTLKFGQTNLDKLTEEQIAVATNKGWTLIA